MMMEGLRNELALQYQKYWLGKTRGEGCLWTPLPLAKTPFSLYMAMIQEYFDRFSRDIPCTKEGWDARKRFIAEAQRQGYQYAVFVKGCPHTTKPEEGCRFVAQSDAIALEDGHSIAWTWGWATDKKKAEAKGEVFDNETYPWYPVHAYRLIHITTGRVLREYTPPTSEEIAAGKCGFVPKASQEQNS